jgi:hypothetical protein
MEKDLKANDLFFKKEEVKESQTKLVPAGYIPIKLSSVGKLGIPSILHIRDYSFEEALAIADIDENNETEVIVQVLNSVIFEDIDAGDLHKNDVLEILMTILGTWYSPKLEDMPYYLNPDLDRKDLRTKENIGKAIIPFSQIKTTSLEEKVNLPITIKYQGAEVKFVLPKVKNEIIAYKLVEMKYSQEENDLSEIKKKVSKGTQTVEEFDKYKDYQKRRSSDFLSINQALLIDSYNGKKLETVEEKLEVLPNLSLSLLKKYQEIVKEHFTFGIDPEVEFYSEELKKTIIRRFDFRTFHFLSTLEQTDDSGFDISFG